MIQHNSNVFIFPSAIGNYISRMTEVDNLNFVSVDEFYTVMLFTSVNVNYDLYF